MRYSRKGVDISTAIRLARAKQNMINREIIENGGNTCIRNLEQLLAKKTMKIDTADRILQAMDYRLAVVPEGANLPKDSWFLISKIDWNAYEREERKKESQENMQELIDKYFNE